MSQIISCNPYPGTRDFYPKDMRYRTQMFSLIEEAIIGFGYEKISGPLLENFEVYAVKSGEEIAEKQLYVFTDKGDRKVAVRPEFTPTIARMFAGKMNDLPSIQRWFSIENFMRYERPQKGRLREFYQVNVDLIGVNSIFADFEILRVAQSVFRMFDATTDMYEIRISHKEFLRDVLVEFLCISDEAVEKVAKIMDKKNKVVQEQFDDLLREVGLTEDQINKLSQVLTQSFEETRALVPNSKGAKELEEIFSLGKVVFKEQNPLCYDFSIVRGLAYYTGLVFESYDKNPANTRALFGGGRYDNLIALFHKNSSVSGVGFAIGDVTFESFLRDHNLLLDEDFLVEKHMMAIDVELPLSLFHTISDHLKGMESVFLDCLGMLEGIASSPDESFVKTSVLKIVELLKKNPFFDQEKYGDLTKMHNLHQFLSESRIKHYSVEIFPDNQVGLGKQLQYANKAHIKYVWICGEPELKKGIVKRKSMDTSSEEEFDLTTFEIY